jgi:DNA-binding MarR family transcriptional regulator/GNAT superfamily N-acetyltransferase
MPGKDFHGRVEAVRRFNRYYTERIHVLDTAFLGSPYNLTQARVLYELAARGSTTATAIARELELDKGYLSRVLQGLRKKGLVARARARKDARQHLLRLTDKGWAVFSDLNARSHADIGSLLGPLRAPDQRLVVGHMRTIERLLRSGSGTPKGKRRRAFMVRPHAPGDLGWVVQRHGALYWEERSWDARFEALVARVVADFAERQDARHERCWIAEMYGERVGSVMLTRASDGVANLRLLLVEPRARRNGIGSRLLEEALGFARRARYEQVALWTVRGLEEAERLYERAGFRRVRQEPLEAFGHSLTSETWVLELRKGRGTAR